MYESKFFKIAAVGVVGVFSVAVVTEAINGHEPLLHIDSQITQPAPGVFGTSSITTSSGTLTG